MLDTITIITIIAVGLAALFIWQDFALRRKYEAWQFVSGLIGIMWAAAVGIVVVAMG